MSPALALPAATEDACHCDSVELLMLLVSLGENLNMEFIRRLRHQKLTWGSHGGIQLQEPPIIPVVTDENRFRIAMRTLEVHFVVSIKDTSVLVAPGVQENIESSTEMVEWKLKALEAVLHVFPEHRQLEPLLYVLLAWKFLAGMLTNVLVTLRSQMSVCLNFNTSCHI